VWVWTYLDCIDFEELGKYLELKWHWLGSEVLHLSSRTPDGHG
jgi:hypothetical protein